MTPAIRGILNEHFEISQSKLLLWRNRYTRAEYPSKVALNLHYAKAKGGAYFPLVAASFGLNHYLANGQQEYVELKQSFAASALYHSAFEEAKMYPISYNIIRSFEKQAEQKVIPILEASVQHLLQTGNQPVRTIQNLVNRANEDNRSALQLLEHTYTVEIMAFETFLAWAAWGLMNMETDEACDKTIEGDHFMPVTMNEYSIVNHFFQNAFVNRFVDQRLVPLPPL